MAKVQLRISDRHWLQVRYNVFKKSETAYYPAINQIYQHCNQSVDWPINSRYDSPDVSCVIFIFSSLPRPTTVCMEHARWMCWDFRGMLNMGQSLCHACGFVVYHMVFTSIETTIRGTFCVPHSCALLKSSGWVCVFIKSQLFLRFGHIQNKKACTFSTVQPQSWYSQHYTYVLLDEAIHL